MDILSDHVLSAPPGDGGGGGEGGIQYINDGGAGHTFQGLKTQEKDNDAKDRKPWCLFVCFSITRSTVGAFAKDNRRLCLM